MKKEITLWKPPEKEIIYAKNVTAKISEISAMGYVTVTFNGTINCETYTKFNLSSEEMCDLRCLNSSVFDLSIVPALNRDLEPDFNASSLNFTWEVQSFTPTTITFKLEFLKPLAISPLDVLDTFVLKFKQVDPYFYSN